MVDATIATELSVYKITHIASGLVYIGITAKRVKRRWQAHVCAAMNGKLTTPLHAAIKAFGVEAFLIETIDSAATRREVGELEKKYIAEFDCVSPKGFNRTFGGEPHHRWSDDARAKAAASRTGKTWTPEVRAKLEAIMATEEYRAKMRAASAKRTPKPLTDAQKAHLSGTATAHLTRPEALARRRAQSIARMADTARREALSEKAKANWTDLDFRRKHSEARAASGALLNGNRPKMSAAAIKRMAEPGRREALSRTIKEKFKDPEYRARYDAGRKKLKERVENANRNYDWLDLYNQKDNK